MNKFKKAIFEKFCNWNREFVKHDYLTPISKSCEKVFLIEERKILKKLIEDYEYLFTTYEKEIIEGLEIDERNRS